MVYFSADLGLKAFVGYDALLAAGKVEIILIDRAEHSS